MSTKKDLVSIVIPCYNMGKYILEALESISAQTYTNWEVIAVDDCGSKDGTEDIVLAFAQKYGTDRVRFIKHENNKGVSAARNTGIKNANGAYIALLDPDDFWTPEHLEKALDYFIHDSELKFYSAFTNLFYASEPSKIFGVECYDDWEMTIFPYMLTVRNSIPTSTCVLRYSVFDTVGMFDEKLNFGEDYDLWIRIVSHGLKIFINKQPTAYYRVHYSSSSHTYTNISSDLEILATKHKEWLMIHQRVALENFTVKIKSLENDLSSQKKAIAILEKRLLSIELTVSKLKSLPILKQFLILKKIIWGR